MLRRLPHSRLIAQAMEDAAIIDECLHFALGVCIYYHRMYVTLPEMLCLLDEYVRFYGGMYLSISDTQRELFYAALPNFLRDRGVLLSDTMDYELLRHSPIKYRNLLPDVPARIFTAVRNIRLLGKGH